MSDEIAVERFKQAVKIRVPCVAKHHVGHGDHVTLTRDEAFDLLDKLRKVLAEMATESEGQHDG